VAAYIDPGSGSMLFQALVAGLLGAMMAIRSVRERIVSLFHSRSSPAADGDPSAVAASATTTPAAAVKSDPEAPADNSA
jgi:hypothetical protein